MIFNSIRWRLQLWHSLLLVVVLAGFGFTAYHVERDIQLRRLDKELEQHLMGLFRPEPPDSPPRDGPKEPHWGRPRQEPSQFRNRLTESLRRVSSPEAGQTNAFYFVWWLEDGSVMGRSPAAPQTVPQPERSGPPELRRLDTNSISGPGPGAPPPFAVGRTRGQMRELYHFLPFGDCLLIGRSMAPEMATLRRLALWLTAAGAGVLVVGMAGGWWVASRAIRPIEEISATALKIAGGDLSQRINASDTESELGRLANVLNSTFARLEAAFAHQVRFTSDASHELRTPLAVILNQTQTALARERSAREYRETLEACQRAAQRMRRLTESLLELARLDAGEEPMKRERFDLSRVARDCVELVRPLAAERNVGIHCELPALECLGDAERIGQVTTNLLSNAIYYNRDHGEVRIATHAENGMALLEVADTGLGIPGEDLPHIFERFYRVDAARSGLPGRTGLGLAISKAIVDAHSGTIDVASQPGSGSRFIVKLPLR